MGCHVMDSQVSTCVFRSSSSSMTLTELEWLCLPVGTVQSPHDSAHPDVTHPDVTHQFPLHLSSSGQGLITSPVTCMLPRSHLFSTHRLPFVNQPFVHCVPAQAYPRSPSLSFKEGPVTQLHLPPGRATQMLRG